MADIDVDNEYKVMVREIYRFVDDLEESIEASIEIESEFDNVMICGMGGSAIGGDIITGCVVNDSKYPVSVHRFPELPHWVNERTFMIISSYSGNTDETLSMYDQAVKKKCQIVILTSGGKLKKLGEEHGDRIIYMSPGVQPRSAIGLVVGYSAVIIDKICGTNCVSELKKLLPSLRRYRDELSGEESEAWEIARAVHGRVPIIYATAGIYPSATRWKSQINENSKTMAFAGSVPEFNHNEISGWSEGELRDKCLPVFLYEAAASKTIRKMADASISSMKEYGQDVRVVNVKGKTTMERILRSMMIGDYVSLYLAHLRGVDPVNVPSIIELKRRLAILMSDQSAGRRKNDR